ncbi:hypothetical protein AGABI1DRAFT_41363 [Agaricus bisporus var. burnettii JB137-S8]|nr:uncharacterized protein AGABI1DRAFT_41363 [Agaricus bisporus var. burnettii JB137-S8]EKM78961.1 hypothetical protein AGABI1DRAFT_41363 [Agaricus bisporus var. burnettii JB137-S8]
MAAHVPTFLSLLSTAASAYPAIAKFASNSSAPPAPPAPPPPTAPSQQHTSNALAPSAPVNVPGSLQPQSNNGPVTMGSPPNQGNPFCDYCSLRPKYSDSGRLHPYCSKTCASKDKRKNWTPAMGNQPPQLAVPGAFCEHCLVNVKYFDGTKTHPFCSKACAKKANRKQSLNVTIPAPKPPGICQAPNCQSQVYTNSNGSLGEYCSIAHKTLGETLCLMCLQAPKTTLSHFCSQTCIDKVEKLGSTILEVPVGHVTFKSVADQFKSSWRHNSQCPSVRRIYKICFPPSSLAAYNTYKSSVEARGQFASQGRSAGNENRRWHGTRRECHLGDKGNTQLCASSTCSLCSIVKNSYDLSLFGKKTGWGRFGRGIYTSSTSSKSNDYSQNDCKSNLKAILLNKVVVGKGHKLTHDLTSLTAPPHGFDSVLAERGGSLNYDELVVYTNDAIRPSFLVMYEL